MFFYENLITTVLSWFDGPKLEFNRWLYISLTSIFLLLWSSLYLFLCQQAPQQSKEWHCREVTLVHATITCILGIAILFRDQINPFSEEFHRLPSTHWMQVNFSLALSYFIFDLYWCLSNNSEGALMLFHHGCSIFGYSVCLFAGKWGVQMTATLIGTELANPLLQIRWFLRALRHERDKNKIHLKGKTSTPPTVEIVVDVAFMISFGLMRLVYGSALLYFYMRNHEADGLSKFGAITIYLIGLIFWVQICLYAWRKYLSKALPISPRKSKESVDNGKTSPNSGLTQDDVRHRRVVCDK